MLAAWSLWKEGMAMCVPFCNLTIIKAKLYFKLNETVDSVIQI